MSDVLWTAHDAAIATGGAAKGQWTVSGISIDTRSLKAGDLFVPLKDVRDGHDFIPLARQKEAGAVMSEHLREKSPALIVEDTQKALRDLGAAARTRSNAQRVAITGSVGKTSLKEAIAAICARQGRTHKSQKSFNNHWGVPLTLATMPANTQYGVFEVGMNHKGELSDLSPLIAPHIAVITRIAPAHLAHFENLDAIAKAKAEIFEGLKVGGAAVLGSDDAYFDFLGKRASQREAEIISFGMSDAATVQIINPVARAGKLSAKLKVHGQLYDLEIPQDGMHWISNAACAVAAALALGISPEDSVAALSEFKALPGRGEVFSAHLGGKNITVMDDSYNANPASMRAAIRALSNRADGRKIAVLGDMFELGKDELRLHAELAGPLHDASVSTVICVGQSMSALRDALPADMRGICAQNWQDAAAALEAEIQDGDTVLIKGSNATGLGRIVDLIKEKQKGVADVL